MKPTKVAVVHDWLSFIGGAELVLLEILKLYPQADVFVLVDGLSDEDRQAFLRINPQLKIIPSFIQKLPFAKNKFDYYLPLMPLAVEQWDFRGYDLVISSTHAFAKGILTSPEQLHVAYVYSPLRYAWDMQSAYLETTSPMAKGWRNVLARIGLHYLRLWDTRTAAGVNVWMAISFFIRRRIGKCYGQPIAEQTQVIYPPVETTPFTDIEAQLAKRNITWPSTPYFVTCSRLVEYKRIDLIVQAFVHIAREAKIKGLVPTPLIVLGEGPMMKPLRELAKDTPSIELRGRVSTAEKRAVIAHAQAFIFAAKEDFGIAPVEAQALGVPVIAYGAGAALETVLGATENTQAATGIFFEAQTPESLMAAINRLESLPKINPDDCRAQAQKFSTQNFRESFKMAVDKAWQDFQHPVH